MHSFKNKHIIVTGGSSGIGLATAKAIVSRGGKVLITGTNPDKLAAAKSLDNRIQTLINDAGDFAQADILAKAARDALGHIDGLFLNAGKGTHSPPDNITPEQFTTLYNLNVGGPLFQIQALLPLFSDKGGSIAITCSGAAHKGFPGGSIYCGTKGAVLAMTRALAKDLVGRNIRVNSVTPGPIATDFFERLSGNPEKAANFAKRLASGHPMGRLGTAEEVAEVALFLLSDASTFVTGSDYVVNGGNGQFA